MDNDRTVQGDIKVFEETGKERSDEIYLDDMEGTESTLCPCEEANLQYRTNGDGYIVARECPVCGYKEQCP